MFVAALWCRSWCTWALTEEEPIALMGEDLSRAGCPKCQQSSLPGNSQPLSACGEESSQCRASFVREHSREQRLALGGGEAAAGAGAAPCPAEAPQVLSSTGKRLLPPDGVPKHCPSAEGSAPSPAQQLSSLAPAVPVQSCAQGPQAQLCFPFREGTEPLIVFVKVVLTKVLMNCL